MEMSRSRSGSSAEWRGRSRDPVPRDYDDDAESIESYESDSSSEYEPVSDKQLQESLQRTDSDDSTEYEPVSEFNLQASPSDSDESTEYEPVSDPKLIANQESTDYGSEGYDEPSTPGNRSEYGRENVHVIPRDDYGVSQVEERDRLQNNYEDESEDYEDSFGEFGSEEIRESHVYRDNSIGMPELESARAKAVIERQRIEEESDISSDESESEESVSISDTEGDSDDDDEEEIIPEAQDDDLFWKRYGYSQNVGMEQSQPFGGASASESSSSHESSNSGSNELSDFDDGDTFKDELYSQAFPSIARMRTDDSADGKSDAKSRASSRVSKGGGFAEKIKGMFECSWLKTKLSSCFDCSEVFQGNFKWYILAFIILIIIGGVVATVVPKRGKGKPTAAPTAAPILSTSPTVTPGQLKGSIDFFVLIPNGRDDGITEEELEIVFIDALNILAPQVLLDAMEPNNDNTNDSSASAENQTVVVAEEKVDDTVGLRGRLRRRELVALSIKLPVLVDVDEIVCPDSVSVPESNLCARVTADIVVITDDGTIDFDYFGDVEDAIEVGKLQEASNTAGSNLTIVWLEDVFTPSPTMTKSPISPSPTSSCYDRDTNCISWASSEPSECELNPIYMNFYCGVSCGVCETESPSTAPSTNSRTNIPTAALNNATSPSPTSSVSPSPTFSSSIIPTQSDIGDNNETQSPSLTPNNVTQSPSPTPSPCVDKNEACSESLEDGSCGITKCKEWAQWGECDNNPSYMSNNCEKSCNICEDDQPTESPGSTSAPTPSSAPTFVSCVDGNARCPEWAEDNQCSINPDYMLKNCEKSCLVCQSGDDDQVTFPPCRDNNSRCPEWASENQCAENPDYMLKSCKLSCNVCQGDGNDQSSPAPLPCVDGNDKCAEWAEEDQCEVNPDYMLKNCRLSCNICGGEDEGDDEQTPDGDDSSGGGNDENPEECKDSREDCRETSSETGECLQTKCAFWASEGECESNPGFMLDKCTKSCGQC